MKKTLPTLLSLLVLAATTAQAQFTFTTNNGTITITGYTGPGGAVTIPDTINGLLVTSIGNFAFVNLNSLTNVTIPGSVTGIGDEAFAGSGLTSVTIPGSVDSIGGRAFDDCASLTAITVDAQNSSYSSVDGVLFGKSQTTLIQYPNGKGGNYMIPDNVSSIGNYAFRDVYSLTSVTIPGTITNVGDFAFEYCAGLTNITILNGVAYIRAGAFSGCSGLTSVTIPGSVASIGYGAFSDCTSLASVSISSGVSEIGSESFSECPNLTSVLVPNSVVTIGDSAFRVSGLTSITLPASVTNLASTAFQGCFGLTAINVDPNNPAYRSVSGVLFDRDIAILMQYPASKTDPEYTIPSTVSMVSEYAFFSATTLTSVIIPSSVINIGYAAFDSSGLTTVTIAGSMVNIDGFAFHNCYALGSVYFRGDAPSADHFAFRTGGPFVFGLDPAVAFYLPGTTGWCYFSANSGLPTRLWLPHVQTCDASFGVRTNQFGFNIAWASGQTVVVEACTNLANLLWSPVSTNTLTSDSVYFSDPQWTNYPARFYRLRQQ